MSPEQANESAAQVISEINDTRIHLTALDEAIARHSISLPIDGKTNTQWNNEFNLQVPRDALPQDIKTALNKLVDLRCTAMGYLSLAKQEKREFLYDYENRFNTQVEAECARRGNRSGIDKIKEQVKSSLGDLTLFKARLDQRVEFWQDKINYCTDVWRMLNTMAVCNGTTARIGETF